MVQPAATKPSNRGEPAKPHRHFRLLGCRNTARLIVPPPNAARGNNKRCVIFSYNYALGHFCEKPRTTRQDGENTGANIQERPTHRLMPQENDTKPSSRALRHRDIYQRISYRRGSSRVAEGPTAEHTVRTKLSWRKIPQRTTPARFLTPPAARRLAAGTTLTTASTSCTPRCTGRSSPR